MRLWVDDLRPAPADWTWVKTVDEALAQLATGAVTEIALDHDLGGPKEGRLVAQWIEQQAHAGKLGPLRWQILTSNPVGRQEIEAALQSAERAWRFSA